MLVRMFAHAEWANTLLLEALRAQPAPDADVQRLFNHVLAAEHLWLSRIAGESARVAVWPVLAIDDAAALARENATSLRALAVAGPAALERSVHYRNSAGHEFDNTVLDILVHVALHGHYHRGQMALRTRAAGGEPEYTDYIGFVRRGR